MVKFKWYLEPFGDDRLREIRITDVDESLSPVSKVEQIIQHLTKELLSDMTPRDIRIFYQDPDGDRVRIKSDAELKSFLNEQSSPYKVFVEFLTEEAAPIKGLKSSSCSWTGHGQLHCTNCHGTIEGYRFVCLICCNFHLCKRCELRGAHPAHDLLRLVTDTVYPPPLIANIRRMYCEAMKQDPEAAQLVRRNNDDDDVVQFVQSCDTRPGNRPNDDDDDDSSPAVVLEQKESPVKSSSAEVTGAEDGPAEPEDNVEEINVSSLQQEIDQLLAPILQNAIESGSAPKTSNLIDFQSSGSDDDEGNGKTVPVASPVILSTIIVEKAIIEKVSGDNDERVLNQCGSVFKESGSGLRRTHSQEPPASFDEITMVADTCQNDKVTSASYQPQWQPPAEAHQAAAKDPADPMRRKLESPELDSYYLTSSRIQIKDQLGKHRSSKWSEGSESKILDSYISSYRTTSFRVQEARDQMLAMGFSDDDGWLTQLLTLKHGNIDQVLDVLTPVPGKSTTP